MSPGHLRPRKSKNVIYDLLHFPTTYGRWKMVAHPCAAEPLNLFRGFLSNYTRPLI